MFEWVYQMGPYYLCYHLVAFNKSPIKSFD